MGHPEGTGFDIRYASCSYWVISFELPSSIVTNAEWFEGGSDRGNAMPRKAEVGDMHGGRRFLFSSFRRPPPSQQREQGLIGPGQHPASQNRR
jgi:hypothetical protein